MDQRRVQLAQRRKAAGYSQDDLAARLGVERSTVVRWESARSDPQPWVRPALADILKISQEKLESLLHNMGDSPDSTAHSPVEVSSSTDLMTASTLRDRVQELNESYSQSPSTALLGPAGQIHGQVDYAREHASNGRARQELLDVQAESATLMGQLVWDVSQRHDHAGSAAYLNQAINASHRAGNHRTEAYATLRKSFIALYGKQDPQTGRKLAQHAADIARCRSPALTGLSLLHVAEGYAMHDESKLSQWALSQAADHLDQVPDDDPAAAHYTPTEFDRLAGSCFLFLGHPTTAQPYLERTIMGLQAKQKSQAIALGNLTLALIRQHKIDEGVTTVNRALEAIERTRGGGGINLAFAAGRELRQWRNEPSVQDVTDRLFALMAAN